MSKGLKEFAKEKGWWNGSEPFDFTAAYSQSGESCGAGRQKSGDELMARHTASSKYYLLRIVGHITSRVPFRKVRPSRDDGHIAR